MRVSCAAFSAPGRVVIDSTGNSLRLVALILRIHPRREWLPPEQGLTENSCQTITEFCLTII
jgi:hypothetical protein